MLSGLDPHSSYMNPKRFKDMQFVESQETRLLIMWFQARKIQRAFQGHQWRVNARVRAEARARAEELKAKALGHAMSETGSPREAAKAADAATDSPRTKSLNEKMRERMERQRNEMTSVAQSFKEFNAYKAVAGKEFLEKLEKSARRPKMTSYVSTRRGILQLERGEIPRLNSPT
jgi:hypothetical protein